MNIFKNKIINFSLLVILLAVFGLLLFLVPDTITLLLNSHWVRYFFLPLIISFIGVLMLMAGMFSRVETWVEKNQKVKQSYKSEKELTKRISRIKKSAF